MKKKYVPPEIEVEPLEVDADFALSCGLSIGASTIACLERSSPNEYEELVYGMGLSPDLPLSESVAFSNSLTCLVSCYHGPYDMFFSS